MHVWVGCTEYRRQVVIRITLDALPAALARGWYVLSEPFDLG